MAHRRKLLAGGIAAILVTAAAPHLHQAWLDRRLRAAAAENAFYVRLKEREIACLERLQADGVPEGMDVGAEIEKCRRLGVEAPGGEPRAEPNPVSVP